MDSPHAVAVADAAARSLSSSPPLIPHIETSRNTSTSTSSFASATASELMNLTEEELEQKRIRREIRRQKRLEKRIKKREKILRCIATATDDTMKKECISLLKEFDLKYGNLVSGAAIASPAVGSPDESANTSSGSTSTTPGLHKTSGGDAPQQKQQQKSSVKADEKRKKKHRRRNSSNSPSPTPKTTAVTSSSSSSSISSGSNTSASTKTKKYRNGPGPEISFPINEECTSLKLSPSGRLVLAGFTDGTLRLFDTTGQLWHPKKDGDENDNGNGCMEEIDTLFDSDSDEEDEEQKSMSMSRKQRMSMGNMVESKSFQHYGAVAGQIHARGVITSLLMDVDCCEDGLYAFGGVLRGSTELVALDLSQIEAYHDSIDNSIGKDGDSNSDETQVDANGDGAKQKKNILDLVNVYRHSDAKLKGFGACIRLKNNTNSSHKLEYRLFTGKGIKNMHIWSFVPPQGNMTVPSWQCLYDSPTNGNTITSLTFRRDANGLLQGISKSDDQKLRVWDLSHEERYMYLGDKNGEEKNSQSHLPRRSIIQQLAKKAKVEETPAVIAGTRPKRPPYIDVQSTEHALRVCGAYVFSGGDSMYNKMGVMFLDVEDIQSPFNHTEFALPNANGDDNACVLMSSRRSARSGRQQRGDLKSVVGVSGMSNDAHNVVLELSDRSFVHYCQKGHQSSLETLPLTTPESSDKRICVTRLRKGGPTVLTISAFDTNKDRGFISMNYLSENGEGSPQTSPLRIGFTETKKKPKKKLKSQTTLSILSDTKVSSTTDSQPMLKQVSVEKMKIKNSSDPKQRQKKDHVSPSPAAKIPKTVTIKPSGNDDLADASTKGSKSLPETQSSVIKGTNSAVVLDPNKKKRKSPRGQTYDKDRKKLRSVSTFPVVPTSVTPKRIPTTVNNRAETDIVPMKVPESSPHGDRNEKPTFVSSPTQDKNRTIKTQHAVPRKLPGADVMVTPERKRKGKTSSNPLTLPPSNEAKTSMDYTKSSTSNIGTSEVDTTEPRPTRVAVSPECTKAEEEEAVVKPPRTDSVRNIAKYFKKPKEGMTSADINGSEKEQKALKRKHVSKIILVDAGNKRSTRGSSAKKRPLHEYDVASALCSLREKATNVEPSPPSSDTAHKVETKSKAYQELESFIANCHKRKRPKLQQLSTQGSVASRVGFEQNVPSSTPSFSSNRKQASDAKRMKVARKNLTRDHWCARRQMAMHHRASHERLRDMVLSTSDRVMNIMTSGKMKPNFSKKQVIEFTKQKLNEGLSHIRQALDIMLDRQRMEATCLASNQSMEIGSTSPELAVSFPFPEVFEHAEKTTLEYITGRTSSTSLTEAKT